MKKLLSLLIVGSNLVCSAATDAEIKEMLAKKDYMSAAVKITTTQLTNGVVTASDMNGLVDAAIKTNAEWHVVYLANCNVIDPIETIALFEKARKPYFMMQTAFNTKNEDVMADTWAKVLDMPETTGKVLYYRRGTVEFRDANFELFKRSSEKILKEYPESYVSYVFHPQFKHPEYRDWSMGCLKNISENTFGVSSYAYINLALYDVMIAKTGFSKTSAFYFENAFTKINEGTVNWIINNVYSCEYKDKAIETMAKSITKSDVAYTFSKCVDKKEKNTKMTERMFSVISKDFHLGLDAAFYLDDIDKVIDSLKEVPMTLTADEVSKLVELFNALDVDHRTAEVSKILRNLNAKYTTKLYNDQKTWEPIIAKLRALVDVRK